MLQFTFTQRRLFKDDEAGLAGDSIRDINGSYYSSFT